MATTLMRWVLAAVLLAGLLDVVVVSQAEAPKPLRLVDLDGRTVAPFETPGRPVHVFVFATFDCPISNRYAPEVRRLSERFGGQARFWIVYPDPTVPVDVLKQHLVDYQYPFTGLRDPQHALVLLTGVRVTPEVAVFDATRRLVYRGRIDDRVVDFGKVRAAPTRRDLEEVLEAAAAGRHVALRTTEAIGCYIPPL